MNNLTDQIRLLKSHKLSMKNGIDPHMKLKTDQMSLIQKEQEKVNKIKIINDRRTRKLRSKRSQFYSKKRALESQIIEMKSMLFQSKQEQKKSLTTLEKLTPQYSQARIILKERTRQMKENAELNKDVSVMSSSI